MSSINQKLDALTLLVQQLVNRNHTTRTSVAKADLQQPADEQVATDLDEALRENKFVQGKCTKWLIEKGFGFVQVGSETVFVHIGSVRLADALRTSELAYLKVVEDTSQQQGRRWKAKEAWRPSEWQAEMSLRESLRAAESVQVAAGRP